MPGSQPKGSQCAIVGAPDYPIISYQQTNEKCNYNDHLGRDLNNRFSVEASYQTMPLLRLANQKRI